MGNVFLLKGVIGILQTTISTGDYSAWLRPTPYLLAGAAAGGAIVGHIFMRKGLGEYKGVFMVTIFEGAHISAGCLSGCVVMEEMAGAPWWRYVMYWFSVVLIIAGMLVINKKSADARIEGKFHIAQSFPHVQLDESVPGEDEQNGLDPSGRRKSLADKIKLQLPASPLESPLGRPAGPLKDCVGTPEIGSVVGRSGIGGTPVGLEPSTLGVSSAADNGRITSPAVRASTNGFEQHKEHHV